MNRELKVMQDRSGLMIKMACVLIILDFITNVLVGNPAGRIALITGILITAVVSLYLLHQKDRFVKPMMYVYSSIFVGVTTFVSVTDTHHMIVNLFFLFLPVVFSIVYQYWKNTLYTTVLSMIPFNWLAIKNGHLYFGQEFPISYVLFFDAIFVAICTVGIVTSIFSERLRKEAYKKEAEAVQSHSRTQEVLQNMTLSAETLNAFSIELNHDMEDTKETSATLFQSFNEMKLALEDMVQWLYEIKGNVQTMDQEVTKINQSSDDMRYLTEESRKKVTETNIEVEQLTYNMQNLDGNIRENVLVTKELTDAFDEIKSIIDSINAISNQTSLLSLNASIEAARAGEHGRGFAVVAEEVKKLANESAHSASQISTILQDLKTKAERTKHMSIRSQEFIVSSQESVETVKQAFESIEENNQRLSGKSNEITGRIQNVSSTSESIIFSVIDLTAGSEENKAHIDELHDKLTNLTEKFEKVSRNFHTLRQQSEDLLS